MIVGGGSRNVGHFDCGGVSVADVLHPDCDG